MVGKYIDKLLHFDQQENKRQTYKQHLKQWKCLKKMLDFNKKTRREKTR